MGKKVREYKSGDFIFAKVKGYPAWPARVQRMNGKKYFVYFYGTGETANLPPNMIFDYAENKDKFLTKTVKRRDFNDGVKQIEHDFANNVPLEQVIGGPVETPAEAANDSTNDTANETMDDSAVDTTAADDTMADESTANATASNDTAVEDSDEVGTLVIDEGKKGRKSAAAKAKETPAKPAKEAKTPRGKAKKDEAAADEEEKKDEEIVSRSGRKIRPKRYIDEQTEDNATLPSPVPKKRRGASPAEKETKDSKTETKDKPADKSSKLYNAIPQSELEDLKEPFKIDDSEKENILIAYLPTGNYVGVKLTQARPANFKNEAARLQWDKQQASNAITLKLQLERGQITPQSVQTQLVMDLNLTDEEKASLDKERETEEKKSRVQFLKTEMKLIELDAKIKTCLCLEKADTELCLKLLDELMGLEVKPLMLLKHPTCLETVKRMRAYVGNTPSWDLSESAALIFSKQAHKIRKQADTLYKNMKDLFITPEGLSFWEFFSDRVLQFKKATSKLTADELLELVHEPLEMSLPSAHTMKAAVEGANADDADAPADEDDETIKKKPTTGKPKKNANSTPAKANLKRQSSRKQQQDEKAKEKETTADAEEPAGDDSKDTEKPDSATEKENDAEQETEPETTNNKDAESKEPDSKETKSKEKDSKKDKDAKSKDKDVKSKDTDEDKPADDKVSDGKDNEVEKETVEKDKEKSPSPSEKEKSSEKEKEDDEREEKSNDRTEDKDVSEPRAKRSRETKKTEAPPPRSPAKRKSKF